MHQRMAAVLFVRNPKFSNGKIILANLNIEKARYDLPNFLYHNAFEKKVINAFIFRAEDATRRLIHLPF
jgi:hypothetical protein